MRMTAFILLITCLHVSATGYSQKVTMTVKDVPLQKVFIEVSRQTGVSILCNDAFLTGIAPVTFRVKDATIQEVLGICLKGLDVTYVTGSNSIIIKAITTPQPSLVQAPQRRDTGLVVRGKILGETGDPLPGATIMIKGSSKGVATGVDGSFSIEVPDDNAVLTISFIGYQPMEMKAWRSGNKLIKLQSAATNIKDVVVRTGMFNRKKETFTGAVASFTGKELKQIGNQNIVQSLKTLDPSFIIAVNNVQGSNPNQLPKIEMRGKTSLTSGSVRDQFANDPNQPLFILNGMETSLQQIIDLDINRVASVTLLKDASSTAIYGSRAANGVLVVETVQPAPGQLNVSYTSDMRFEVPDLRDYNMMSAAENLEFQRLAGLYTNRQFAQGIYMDNLYNARLRAVKEGVNSYWLSTPLHNGFTNGHSLRVNGGSEEFQYAIGLNYRNANGVMKGSDRKTWGGTVDLNYRKNKLNISNQVYINGTNSDGSPYGSFSQYVNMNPFYKKYRNDGSLNTDRYLEVYKSGQGQNFNVANPLYNATLNQVNNQVGLTVQNNLALIWDFATDWRLSGGLQVQKTKRDNKLFYPASHTMFDSVDVTRKGRYTGTTIDESGYQSNVMLTYSRVFNGLHSLTGNVRGEVQEQQVTSTAFTAEGFPVGVNPNPAFAYGYQLAGKPAYSRTKVRRVNGLASVNYAYDNRYYADANFRMDGSTSFGSENKYSPFWSVGLGWTLSREQFFRHIEWISLLRIRGNIGITGNQAFGSFASSSVFGFDDVLNMFGQGLYLTQLGNPRLEWQRTKNISVGTDLAMLGNRLTGTINAYQKLSSPLITTGSVPASTGVSGQTLNVGNLRTRGVEAIIRYSPIYRPGDNVVWTLGYTGSLYKSRYEGFSGMLKNLNDEAQASNSLQRFIDGYSPDQLWAVPSLGIDPATGQEVFLKKNGEKTFVYDPEDIRPYGEGRPVVEGVVSSNLSIKGFTLGINLRYSIGTYIFNTALFNKVENISLAGLQFNQDKRALQQRWLKPGDVAGFRAINISAQTPISSRFIQRENFLTGESVNAGYEFRSAVYPWLRRAGLQTIRVNAYMNDILRLSNIRSERGIDYPFSNAVSFSINLFF